MPVEKTDTIQGLDPVNPKPTDYVHELADHVWLLKSVLKKIFPGKTGQGLSAPVTASGEDLSALRGFDKHEFTHGWVTGAGSKRQYPTVVAAIQDLLEHVKNIIKLNAQTQAMLEKVYPVGTVYINRDDGTSPDKLLGFGTWTTALGHKTIVGMEANNPPFDSPGEGGYAKTLYPHNHSGQTGFSSGHSHGVPTSGADHPDLNYPPYRKVHAWVRTA